MINKNKRTGIFLDLSRRLSAKSEEDDYILSHSALSIVHGCYQWRWPKYLTISHLSNELMRRLHSCRNAYQPLSEALELRLSAELALEDLYIQLKMHPERNLIIRRYLISLTSQASPIEVKWNFVRIAKLLIVDEVDGHAGKLVFGLLGQQGQEVPVVLMLGRAQWALHMLIWLYIGQ